MRPRRCEVGAKPLRAIGDLLGFGWFATCRCGNVASVLRIDEHLNNKFLIFQAAPAVSAIVCFAPLLALLTRTASPPSWRRRFATRATPRSGRPTISSEPSLARTYPDGWGPLKRPRQGATTRGSARARVGRRRGDLLAEKCARVIVNRLHWLAPVPPSLLGPWGEREVGGVRCEGHGLVVPVQGCAGRLSGKAAMPLAEAEAMRCTRSSSCFSKASSSFSKEGTESASVSVVLLAARARARCAAAMSASNRLV